MISKYNLRYKGDLRLDLHLPEAEVFDLFIYFHGGGLVSGEHGGVEVFAETLAKANVATATVEYSMYPEVKFPDFIVDCASAIAWLKEHICEYGRCDKFFVGGSSAGGYISMMLCFDDKYLNDVGLNPTDVSAYIHDAGQPTSHFNVLKELGMDKRRVVVDQRAPMYYVGTSDRYSPMLFIVSDEDMPARYEQTMLMIKTLECFGHGGRVRLKLMHAKHCDYVYKKDEEGEGVLGRVILSFLKDEKILP